MAFVLLLALPVMVPRALAQSAGETIPSNLIAEAVDNGVRLLWDPPQSEAESITGYEILRRLPLRGGTEFQTLVPDTASTDTTYTDTTASTPGERYAYRVKALRGDAKSQASGEASVDLPPEDPDATHGGAISLGIITGLETGTFLSDTVDGGSDRVDYFVFGLTQANGVDLTLGLMERNADLFLEDSGGSVLHESRAAGLGEESLSGSLEAGIYYVRIEAQEVGENGYLFHYEVSAPEAAPAGNAARSFAPARRLPAPVPLPHPRLRRLPPRRRRALPQLPLQRQLPLRPLHRRPTPGTSSTWATLPISAVPLSSTTPWRNAPTARTGSHSPSPPPVP